MSLLKSEFQDILHAGACVLLSNSITLEKNMISLGLPAITVLGIHAWEKVVLWMDRKNQRCEIFFYGESFMCGTVSAISMKRINQTTIRMERRPKKRVT
jgi:hypothetical protein